MAASTAMTLDPRGRRLAKLFASGVLDMQDEKATQLNIAPSNPYDQYQRLLRSQPSSIRQQATPADQETRDVEVATDEIIMKDKEVQFSYGDDTRLLNIIRVVVERREARKAGKVLTESLLDMVDRDVSSGRSEGVSTATVEGNSSGASTSNGVEENRDENSSSPRATGKANQSAATGTSSDTAVDPDSLGAGSRLGFFLQRASQLCETLMDETRNRRTDAQATSRDDDFNDRRGKHLFADTAWQPLGQGRPDDPKGRLVAARRTVAVRFSPLQPHLLVTAHPYADDDTDDAHPQKVCRSAYRTYVLSL
jgi:hypothetical protein